MTKQDNPKKPPRHSPRAKAWLYGVVNPMIDAFEREQQLLQRGTITWRDYNRRPEYIARPADYLDPGGRTNLEDMLRFYAEVQPRLERHAGYFDHVDDAAGALYNRLVTSPQVRDEVTKAIEFWKEVGSPTSGSGIILKAEEIHPQVSQHLVNEVRELERNHNLYHFWEQTGDRLRQAAESTFGDLFQKLRTARVAFLADTTDLIGFMKNLRATLCDDYDLPPSPLPY